MTKPTARETLRAIEWRLYQARQFAKADPAWHDVAAALREVRTEYLGLLAAQQRSASLDRVLPGGVSRDPLFGEVVR